MKIVQFILSNWDTILGLGSVVWETIARVAPTKKSLSIINGIKKVADVVVPNIATSEAAEGKVKEIDSFVGDLTVHK